MSAVTQADLERVYGELSHRLAELKRNGRANNPVGTTTTVEVDAYAWCPIPTCKANEQRKVRAIRETRSFTVGDRSGEVNTGGLGEGLLLQHVENTYTYLRFEHEADKYCGHCNRMLELAEQQRPAYPPISGHDPMALVKRMRGQLPEWTDDGTKLRSEETEPADPERVARLEGQLSALMALMQGGKVDVAAFQALNEADSKLPAGIRQRGEKFQARLNKSETPEGEPERILGTFDTLEEAVGERDQALSRIAGAEVEALADQAAAADQALEAEALADAA